MPQISRAQRRYLWAMTVAPIGILWCLLLGLVRMLDWIGGMQGNQWSGLITVVIIGVTGWIPLVLGAVGLGLVARMPQSRAPKVFSLLSIAGSLLSYAQLAML
ncbi:MAG: hypothetical protein ACK5KU_03675 [Beutenbergiaceae bacterium]